MVLPQRTAFPKGPFRGRAVKGEGIVDIGSPMYSRICGSHVRSEVDLGLCCREVAVAVTKPIAVPIFVSS